MTRGPVSAANALPAATKGGAVRRPLLFIAGLLVLLAAAPFAINLAGDAQVHLAIAEAFADGRPFQYNPGGEIVVASTSPFWTILLVLFYRLVGDYAPALLSAVAVGFWLASAYALFRAARDLWDFRGVALWAGVLLWLAHATIVANALGGLENVAGALQLLLLYYLVAGRRWTGDDGPRASEPLSARRAILIGAVLGWALLTRPDSGAFALLLFALSLPQLVLDPPSQAVDVTPDNGANRRLWTAGRRLFLLSLTAAAVLLPWFVYQYTITGNFLTDSSVARLYNGRMGSVMLIPDRLYLHPKAIVSLSSAFLPLAAGFVVTTIALAARFMQAKRGRLALYRQTLPQLAAVLLVIAGVVFYTFIVGAEAFGRYFLPLFPFFFLTGVAGLATVYRRLVASGRPRTAVALVILAALFLAGTSAVDYYRRLGPGRFMPERALDVIYGPANRRYYSPNMPRLVAAPGMRREYTDGFLSDLGRSDAGHDAGLDAGPGVGHVSIAVTEVQLRYFLDERVTVLSLDGRTSADILRYVDPTTGVPDFEAYFLEARPDYVHANQWCEIGGWLATFSPSSIPVNLVCSWERQAERMGLGDSFEWQGRAVTLVAPEILRIDWTTP